MAPKPARALIGVLIAALILPLTLCVCGFFLPPQFGETFLGIFPQKHQRLTQGEGKRIILVGGSSVPFGIKSGLMEAHLQGYCVIDFGLYADIGTPVMLDFLEEQLRPGDIVILSPEQHAQALSDRCNYESLWQAMDGHWSLLTSLHSSRWESLIAAFPGFAGKKCYYALTGSPKVEGIYQANAFDDYTDISSPLRQNNIMAGGYDPNLPISFDTALLTEEILTLFEEFYQTATDKGANVYYRFPPMNAAAVTDPSEVDDYYDALRARLPFPILGDPHRSILESGWFYDTNFHLNESGAIVFTKGLIEDLKILFRDTSVTHISLPEMPPPAQSAIVSGDTSCADCFTYESIDGGWRITGLTDKGASANRLIVPTHFQEAPVLELMADVFTGNQTLRELTIQANIRTLHDGMFAGSALTKLHLTAASPGNYTVGDALRSGADFLIYVPGPATDSYRRHYSWQQYDSWILPES